MRGIAFAAALLVGFGAVACGDRNRQDGGGAGTTDQVIEPAPPTTMPETAESPGAPRTFTFEERDQFTQSIRDRLAELDREIDDLDSQAKSAGGAVSDRALENVRAARRAVERSLERVNAATAAEWEDVRGGVDQAMDNLTEAVEAAYPK